MRGWKLLSYLTVGVLLMTACSPAAKETRKPSEKKEEVVEQVTEMSDSIKTSLEKDATTFFNAILTKSDSGFGKLYGDSYEDWTDDTVFPQQVAEMVNDIGLEPEEEYTLVFPNDEDALPPTHLLTTFLKLRRDMITDIEDYEIKQVTINGDEAMVTISSRSINATAASRVIYQLAVRGFGSEEAFEEVDEFLGVERNGDKLKTIIRFYLFNLVYGGELLGYSNIPAQYSYTPQTVAQQEKTVSFTKNKDGKWTVSAKDYRNFISDMMFSDKNADVYYSEINETVREQDNELGNKDELNPSDYNEEQFTGESA